MSTGRVSHFFVNTILGIDTNERYARLPADLDKRARDTVDPADIYFEDEPSVAEWFKDLAPSGADVVHYFQSLFPSAAWLPRYNGSWLMGDVLAGSYGSYK